MSKYSSQIPTSYFSIGILPKYSFNVESYTVGNPWEEIAINSIVNSYFDLIFKDLLVLVLISEGRKIFFNKIDWKLAEYQIRLSSTFNKNIELPWLESKIIEAIIEEANSETFSLKGSVVKLINSILPDPVNYINPSKQVIAKIVTESNSNLWSFESKDLKRLFVGPNILYKLKIELSEKNQRLIISERRKFEELLKIEIENTRTKKLHYTLFKLAKKQINSRVDLD